MTKSLHIWLTTTLGDLVFRVYVSRIPNPRSKDDKIEATYPEPCAMATLRGTGWEAARNLVLGYAMPGRPTQGIGQYTRRFRQEE